MEPVARGALGDLGKEALGIEMEQPVEVAAASQLAPQCLGGHAFRLARYLYQRPVGGSVGAEEHRESHHSFASDAPHLDRGPVLARRRDRDDGIQREVHRADPLVRLGQALLRRQVDGGEVGFDLEKLA